MYPHNNHLIIGIEILSCLSKYFNQKYTMNIYLTFVKILV